MQKTTVTADDVKKIAKLASLPVNDQEIDLYAKQFSETIKIIDELQEVDTKDLHSTSQVISLKNVTRPDKVDKSRILTQAEALSNASQTYKGFFVVKQIIDK